MIATTKDEGRNQQPAFFKIGELAELFRVDRRTIKRWCKRGQLPQPLRIGGSSRWRKEDIQKAISEVDR